MPRPVIFLPTFYESAQCRHPHLLSSTLRSSSRSRGTAPLLSKGVDIHSPEPVHGSPLHVLFLTCRPEWIHMRIHSPELVYKAPMMAFLTCSPESNSEGHGPSHCEEIVRDGWGEASVRARAKTCRRSCPAAPGWQGRDTDQQGGRRGSGAVCHRH